MTWPSMLLALVLIEVVRAVVVAVALPTLRDYLAKLVAARVEAEVRLNEHAARTRFDHAFRSQEEALRIVSKDVVNAWTKARHLVHSIGRWGEAKHLPDFESACDALDASFSEHSAFIAPIFPQVEELVIWLGRLRVTSARGLGPLFDREDETIESMAPKVAALVAAVQGHIAALHAEPNETWARKLTASSSARSPG